MREVMAGDLAGAYELSFDEIDLVSGGEGIGAVSSDAVFGAGVAVVIFAATLPVSAPIGVVAAIAFGGGFLIGWGISQ